MRPILSDVMSFFEVVVCLSRTRDPGGSSIRKIGYCSQCGMSATVGCQHRRHRESVGEKERGDVGAEGGWRRTRRAGTSGIRVPQGDSEVDKFNARNVDFPGSYAIANDNE
jgi:hypothetical protein